MGVFCLILDKSYLYISISFYEDKTGYYEYLDSFKECSWSIIDEDTACITLEDNSNIYLNFYQNSEDETNTIWMKAQIDNKIVWFY